MASHVESKYMKQESEQVFERRQKLMGHNRSGQHEIPYVPF
ncbi:MAG: hypothetical protein R2680_00290 [Nitrososphaeraceae archaeon]